MQKKILTLFRKENGMNSKFILTEIQLALIGIDWLSDRSYKEFSEINDSLNNFFTEEPQLFPKISKNTGNNNSFEISIPLISASNQSNQSRLIVNIDRLDFVSKISSEDDLNSFQKVSETLLKKYSTTKRIGIISTYLMDESEPDKWFAEKVYCKDLIGVSENLVRFNMKSQYKEKFKSNKIVQIQTSIKRSPDPNVPSITQIQVQNDINTPSDVMLKKGDAFNFFHDKFKIIKINADEGILK